MGWFTAFTEAFYPKLPMPALIPGPTFSSANARILSWAAQLAYETDDHSKVERILTAWGWTFVSPLSVLLPSPLRGRTLTGFVAQAGTERVVTFAGTEPENLQNWLRNFSFVPNADGIHSGFARGVNSVIALLASAVDGAPGGVWFTGHSLGAAIAALSAHRLCATNAPGAARIQAVSTCGMPRLGTERFAASYACLPIAEARLLDEQTFRLVYGEDIVPQTPPSQAPFRFRHVGRVLKAPRAGLFDPAMVGPGMAEDAGVVDLALIRHLLSALALNDADNLPSYPGQNPKASEIVATLPRALRDHCMDRYLGAIQ